MRLLFVPGIENMTYRFPVICHYLPPTFFSYFWPVMNYYYYSVELLMFEDLVKIAIIPYKEL